MFHTVLGRENQAAGADLGLMTINDKLAAAAHLVIARLRSDQLGATKLNKILWFADCEFYRRHGRSLTGERNYVRRDNGPCPYRMEAVLGALKEEGKIVEQLQPVLHYTRREFTAVAEPDVEQFTSEEVDLLLSVALDMAQLSATEASNLSHDDLWAGLDNGWLMSVAAGSVRFAAPTPERLAWAREAFAGE